MVVSFLLDINLKAGLFKLFKETFGGVTLSSSVDISVICFGGFSKFGLIG